MREVQGSLAKRTPEAGCADGDGRGRAARGRPSRPRPERCAPDARRPGDRPRHRAGRPGLPGRAGRRRGHGDGGDARGRGGGRIPTAPLHACTAAGRHRGARPHLPERDDDRGAPGHAALPLHRPMPDPDAGCRHPRQGGAVRPPHPREGRDDHRLAHRGQRLRRLRRRHRLVHDHRQHRRRRPGRADGDRRCALHRDTRRGRRRQPLDQLLLGLHRAALVRARPAPRTHPARTTSPASASTTRAL